MTGRQMPGLHQEWMVFLDAERQVEAWRKANRTMRWRIGREEFKSVGPPPLLTESDCKAEYRGIFLFYGFGKSGEGASDMILSGRLSWEYVCTRRKKASWKCEYLEFDGADRIRPRPGARPRPRGFYYAKVQFGRRFQGMSVAEFRKEPARDTALGPEGIQLFGVTHPHLAEHIGSAALPRMALADYDVAPHGFYDFFDVPHLFCANGILGLGIGNIENDYPEVGIPTLRFT